MNRIVIAVLMLGNISCINSNKKQALNNEARPIEAEAARMDTAITSTGQYIGLQIADTLLYVLDSKGDTLQRIQGVYNDFEFSDYNGDGSDDLITHLVGNVHTEELYLFEEKSNHFRQVIDFHLFNEPKSITGTKYFYSYHRSGCADMNWTSDLFFIEDFKATCIGSIEGQQCEDDSQGIFISKVRGDKRDQIDKVPIAILENYRDSKWGFIKGYWTKNYSKFETQ